MMSTMMSAAKMSAVPIPIKEPNTGVSCNGSGCVGGDTDDDGATAFEATAICPMPSFIPIETVIPIQYFAFLHLEVLVLELELRSELD